LWFGKTLIRADWIRANEFVSLEDIPGLGLRVVIIEEHTLKKWAIHFKYVHAFRLAAEEVWPRPDLPSDVHSGFYQVRNSEWIRELSGAHDLERLGAEHFIIGCYDEIIEVVGGQVSFEEFPAEDQ
jgi:hypothetical protein